MPFIYTWADADLHNPPMTSHLFRDMTRGPDSKLETGTGWSGSKTLLIDDKFKSLTSFIFSKLPERPASIMGWGNILRPGEIIGSHNHLNPAAPIDNHIAGVYYLTPGTLVMTGGGTFHLHPGQVILFKASQVHHVPPSPILRVSIAFNVRMR